MDITTELQKPDFQVLNWSTEDTASCSDASRTLGCPAEAGHLLYKDLQTRYVED